MYALGVLGDGLYMIGGQMKVHNHYIITDSVVRWSLKRGGSWLSFAPLPLPLACHCTITVKEHLYVLGGWTPQVQNSSLLHCFPKAITSHFSLPIPFSPYFSSLVTSLSTNQMKNQTS